jgi:hypothetical protein
MTTLRTLAIASPLVWGLAASAEQIPAGTYTNQFYGTAALYDVSGAYHQSISGLTLDCTLNMDSKGKVNGQGAVTFSNFTSYGVSGNMAAALNGAVKSVNNVARVRLSIRMKGSISVEDFTVKFSGNLKDDMKIDLGSRQMSGIVSGSVAASVPGYGKMTTKLPATPIQLDLPPDETGAWDLALDLVPDGNKYSGTATATLAAGNSYPLTVTGTYSQKSGISKLTLKGQQAMTLTLVVGIQNGQIQFQSLKGKALGQKPHTP